MNFPVLKLHLAFGFYRFTGAERRLFKFQNKFDLTAIFRLLFHIFWLSYNLRDLDVHTNERTDRQVDRRTWLVRLGCGWFIYIVCVCVCLLSHVKYIIDWHKLKVPFYHMDSGYTFTFHSFGKSKFEYTLIPSVQNIEYTKL